MKTILVFACFIALSLAETLESEEDKLEHIHDECQANPATFADDELLNHLSENLDNPHVGAHMLCESKGVGLQDEDGKLNYDVIKKKICLTLEDKDEADKLVKECAIQRETPEKTAVYLFMCLDNHGITYFHHFDHDH